MQTCKGLVLILEDEEGGTENDWHRYKVYFGGDEKALQLVLMVLPCCEDTVRGSAC